MNLLPTIAADAETTDDELWFKDAIIYQLHVKAFADSNNDGVGDFPGLIDKLDYLRDLGVTCLWLLPFYPSPGRDDGYDISDYGDINPQFGTMKDFRRFMQEAKRRDLHVITELVINHTSDQHDWFKRAKRSPKGSSARNWYVWSDTDQKYKGTRIIFNDMEKSNWTWSDEAQAFYWHRFFHHQPDLNFENPRVFVAMMRVMKRWLDAGVDGFRLDAIAYLCEREGTSNDNLPETHAIIKMLRAELDSYARGKVLLAEANHWPEDVQRYFGDGDECHMAYHFPLMPRIYMAIAQEDRFPIADILRQTPEIPPNCQWAMFLRNHDELTLETVTDSERDYLWSTYAADPRARINLGIRRRLAPLMDNDRRKIELMNAILLSMPGTPIIYYGDEIGMGDNIYLGDRNGVRTPMQWTPDRNGGFSHCDPAQIYLPPIMDPIYGYSVVNVESQSRSLSSLLNWTKRLIGVRKSTRIFGRGTLTFIRPKNRAVLAYVRALDDEAILCVANLSRAAQAVELDLDAWKGRVPQEMLGRSRFPRIGDHPYVVTLPPYGFFWFNLLKDADTLPEQILPRELTTLVLGEGWDPLLSGFTRRTFEGDVLPAFLPERKWFPARISGPVKAHVSAAIPIEHADDRFLVVVADSLRAGGVDRYFLPLTIRWTRHTAVERPSANILAAVRRGPREGTLLDATSEPEFSAALLAKIKANDKNSSGSHSVEFRSTSAFVDEPPALPVSKPTGSERFNSSVVVDNKYVIKILRRIGPGLHPDAEIGRYLLEQTNFRNVAPLLGTAELVEGDNRSALAIVTEFIENQGDAWSISAGVLDRLIDEVRLTPTPGNQGTETASLVQRMRQIGTRTAELHLALAGHGDIAAFAPEPTSAAESAERAVVRTERARAALELLAGHQGNLDLETLPLAQRLLSRRGSLLQRIETMADNGVQKIRVHGDLHLARVLFAKEDAYFINFGGDSSRSIAERRRKAPAAVDVAGILRSIDYATGTALDRAPDLKHDERATLAQQIGGWRAGLAAAFWTAYSDAVGSSPLWPAGDEERRKVLDLSLVARALAEIEYRITHARGRLAIPLGALLRLLDNEPS